MISSLELARECGISQGTVDRAIHNRPGVSAKTRQRVLRIARRHGYRPHPAARELLTGRSNMVGAILPTVNNIFFMDLFNEIGRALAVQNLRLHLTPVENRTAFLEVLEEFAARRCRFVLAIPPEDNIPIPQNLAASVSLLTLLSPCRGKGLHFLCPDEEQVGRDAVRYLYQKGHRRILHITSSRRAYAIATRTRGCRMTCTELGLPLQVIVDIDAEKFDRALKRGRPTAIFCHNDWLALQVLLLLSKKGVRVPGDVSILGVDNSPTLIALQPTLTTMAYPMAATVNAVLKLLAGQAASLQSERYKVVERETVRSLAPAKTR